MACPCARSSEPGPSLEAPRPHSDKTFTSVVFPSLRSDTVTHWYDELLTNVRAHVGEKRSLVINAGLSVSGLQHVGRLRGEITLSHLLARSLRDEGREVLQSLVLYTQDEWKGKEGQLAQFPAGQGRRYVGRRLIDVPDPKGCHANWVDHFWEDFGGVLDRFAPGVRTVTTTETYRRADVKALVRDLVARAEEVRSVVNKYRGRHPYPAGWLPFDAFCESCGTTGANTLAVEGESAAYACERCGSEGWSTIERGKLNWRLEWPMLWKVYGVDVEPFGKDHATPGGSRDSCKEIAESIMRFVPPMGVPYEWVGISDRGKDLGDMGSSDFLGFTPVQWLEVGDPEVLRYIYAFSPIFRRIVLDLARLDTYHEAYDSAEAAHWIKPRTREVGNEARSYELAQMTAVRPKSAFVLSYRHAAFLSQISPESGRLEWCLGRLRDTGILAGELTSEDRARVERRLVQAAAWVAKYAPENRVVLLERLTPEIRGMLDPKDRASLRAYAERAAAISWQEGAIKESMVALTRAGSLPVETSRFFRNLYLVLLGQERGPRAAPFLAILPKDWVVRRLAEAAE